MLDRLPAPSTMLRWFARMDRPPVRFTLPRMQSGFALTFDDGPHPQHTSRILAALAAISTQATFFFQGELCIRWPHLVRQAAMQGHQVASHGWIHQSARRQSSLQVLENARRCHETLCSITGSDLPKLYRPPYGEMTVGGLLQLSRAGFEVVNWSYDSLDSFVSDSQVLLERFRREPPAARDIILLHEDYELTVDALPTLLGWLQSRASRLERIESVRNAVLTTAARRPAS